MSSKIQNQSIIAPDTVDFEGALTSNSNQRPDELILRHAGSKWSIIFLFNDGKRMELPLHFHLQNAHAATLVIPEKYYKEDLDGFEIKSLLNDVFRNQRSLDVDIEKNQDYIIIQPLNSKNHLKFTFMQ